QRFDCRLAQRHMPLLRPLSEDGEETPADVDVGHCKPTEFSDPEAAPVEELEHGVVTESDGWLVVVDPGWRLVEEVPDLGPGQDRRGGDGRDRGTKLLDQPRRRRRRRHRSKVPTLATNTVTRRGGGTSWRA